ncbi:MAG: PAS domain S-box protein, partial [Desulfuromonadales bacterium]
CNRMFERFFGAKEEDIIGKTDYDFVDRELADSFCEHDRNAMGAGKPTGNEEWITYSDNGQRALLETVKTPMYDNDGKMIGVLGVARDITGRIQAEKDRLKMEREFQQSQIFQTISDSIIMIDTEGCLANFNAAAEKVCGYTIDMIGRKITEIGPGFSEVLQESLSSNFPREMRCFELCTPEGKNRIFSLRATPVNQSIWIRFLALVYCIFAVVSGLSSKRIVQEKQSNSCRKKWIYAGQCFYYQMVSPQAVS